MTKIRIDQISGDWTLNGQIDTVNRQRWLDIAIVEGVAYGLDWDGCPETDEPPIYIDADGGLCPAGASVGFLPDPGEIERIGGYHMFRPLTTRR